MAGLFNAAARNHLIRSKIRSKKRLIVDDFRLPLMSEMIFYSLWRALRPKRCVRSSYCRMQMAGVLNGDLKMHTFLKLHTVESTVWTPHRHVHLCVSINYVLLYPLAYRAMVCR